jgi:formylmethanofuran dehydrogenase subunit E
MDITHLIEKSMEHHDHLCPRQILGVRIGLAGMNAVGFTTPPLKKELLVISETDGCFVDGVTASTGCTVGHRTLRVEDYGKVAITCVNVNTGYAVRAAPCLDVRERASAYFRDEARHYFAQLQAYQIMPDDELLSIQEVVLNTSIKQIVSRPGIRVNCAVCGEEIMNEREVIRDGVTYCLSCTGNKYYQSLLKVSFPNNIPIFSEPDQR